MKFLVSVLKGFVLPHILLTVFTILDIKGFPHELPRKSKISDFADRNPVYKL